VEIPARTGWPLVYNKNNNQFYRPFVQDYTGEPVPEETFAHSHLSWSSAILCQLSPSAMIHSILPVQFTCLSVFLHNLFPSPVWSPSWSVTLHFVLHTFLHPIIVFFRKTCPYQRNLFCCSTEIMSFNPGLSQLFTWNSFTFTLHIHPSILIFAHWSATSLAICRPSGCTMVSGVVVIVIVGICNHSQMRTSKCAFNFWYEYRSWPWLEMQKRNFWWVRVRGHTWHIADHLWMASSFFYKPGLTSMQHTTLHTPAVQTPSHYQWYIHIGKQWYQMPELRSLV